MIKLMGTGSGTGFSIVPDFRRYAVLFFFENSDLAYEFASQNEKLQWYFQKSESSLAAVLNPVKGHGSWAGEVPFRYSGEIHENEPIAVITRATIRTRKLAEFWYHVPKTAAFMSSSDSLHQVGIGEYPIFMQATFSIWESIEKLRDAAYHNTPHAEIVRKTRERRWYKEELFAEFNIASLSIEGNRFKKLNSLSIPPVQV